MVRYFRLVTDAADLRLEQEGEAYRFEVGYAGGVEPAKESIDAFISLFLRFCRSQLGRSEEHTSELQSLMRNSYAVFCLKKNKTTKYQQTQVTISLQTNIRTMQQDNNMQVNTNIRNK